MAWTAGAGTARITAPYLRRSERAGDSGRPEESSGTQGPGEFGEKEGWPGR